MGERQPKWLERLSIFKNAINRMAEVVELSKQHALNQFERDSLIKRFEFTYEMAWKLMMSFEKGEYGTARQNGANCTEISMYGLTDKS